MESIGPVCEVSTLPLCHTPTPKGNKPLECPGPLLGTQSTGESPCSESPSSEACLWDKPHYILSASEALVGTPQLELHESQVTFMHWCNGNDQVRFLAEKHFTGSISWLFLIKPPVSCVLRIFLWRTLKSKGQMFCFRPLRWNQQLDLLAQLSVMTPLQDQNSPLPGTKATIRGGGRCAQSGLWRPGGNGHCSLTPPM